MSFDQDPNEQANISGADLAILIDELAALRLQVSPEMVDSYQAQQELIVGLSAQLTEVRTSLAAAESMRPFWAMGYSSDSIAAQSSFVALAALWKLLGVDNQTQAVAVLTEAITVLAELGAHTTSSPSEVQHD